MASEFKSLRIQVCFARPDRQLLKDALVPEGMTIEEAVRLSGITNEMTGIDLAACKVGVYGKLKPLNTRLREGDRIEIYRPLLADPKDARRRRAQKKK